ncbi:methyltransferase domain-containing protein [Ascidiimonas sp. W6]|uniref:methyltransferase domain-containing protein n=1 Tax=Ascidiimonas meishanensis TaxID=3128903 RepID=UPI0030EC5C01
MIKDLSKRSHDPEIMDDFDTPLPDLKEVLDDINRVNTILGGFEITNKAVTRLIQENPKQSYTIVDVGCAEGSMLRKLATSFRKKRHQVNFIGIDLNEEALLIAKERSKNFPEISYLKQDIFTANFQNLGCDIVISTLTMHHFNDEAIVRFIKYFIKIATIGVVINDLQRSVWAYYLFKLFSLIFIKTRVAKIDGLISIRRAFIRKELISYTKNLPGVNHKIEWKWAFRYLWLIRKT